MIVFGKTKVRIFTDYIEPKTVINDFTNCVNASLQSTILLIVYDITDYMKAIL